MEPTTPATPTVRAAHARLAAIRRHRPGDAPAIAAAKRDLAVARGADMAARAARLIRGERDR